MKEQIGLDIDQNELFQVWIQKKNEKTPKGDIENEFCWVYTLELKSNDKFSLTACSARSSSACIHSSIATASNDFRKESDISDSLKLVIYNPDDKTVDIRYYKKSDGYTGFTKKGIRVTNPNAEKLSDMLKSL